MRFQIGDWVRLNKHSKFIFNNEITRKLATERAEFLIRNIDPSSFGVFHIFCISKCGNRFLLRGQDLRLKKKRTINENGFVVNALNME